MEMLERNWQCAVGEIDIVAEELERGRRTVVFCEVKCRTGLGFGDPLEAITYAKLRKLRQLAGEWLAASTKTSADGGPDRRDRRGHADRPSAPADTRAGDRVNLAKSWSVALVGLDGRLVEVEAHIGSGLPRTVLVGLPDASLYEARDRCKAAVANSGESWPSTLLTINLSPATLPEGGQQLRPRDRRGRARGC